MTAQVAKAEYTGQTGDISTTTIYTPLTKWFFRVSVYMICTTAGSAGTLACTIGWTDESGAKTLKVSADIVLDNIANGSTGNEFIVANASAITFTTTITGGADNPVYALYIIIEQMG